MKRKEFIKKSLLTTAAIGLAGAVNQLPEKKKTLPAKHSDTIIYQIKKKKP
jgi:hypothetical protein